MSTTADNDTGRHDSVDANGTTVAVAQAQEPIPVSVIEDMIFVSDGTRTRQDVVATAAHIGSEKTLTEFRKKLAEAPEERKLGNGASIALYILKRDGEEAAIKFLRALSRPVIIHKSEFGARTEAEPVGNTRGNKMLIDDFEAMVSGQEHTVPSKAMFEDKDNGVGISHKTWTNFRKSLTDNPNDVSKRSIGTSGFLAIYILKREDDAGRDGGKAALEFLKALRRETIPNPKKEDIGAVAKIALDIMSREGKDGGGWAAVKFMERIRGPIVPGKAPDVPIETPVQGVAAEPRLELRLEFTAAIDDADSGPKTGVGVVQTPTAAIDMASIEAAIVGGRNMKVETAAIKAGVTRAQWRELREELGKPPEQRQFDANTQEVFKLLDDPRQSYPAAIVYLKGLRGKDDVPSARAG